MCYVENWVYKGLAQLFVSADYLPYMYMSDVYTPIHIYRGGKQRTYIFLILTLYIPKFTLISDLASDLGVTSGFLETLDMFGL